jgi:putative RecB family exonuclease
MEERRTFSLSQIQAYLGCPLKYRFQYLDKIPKPFRPSALAFGSSIHAAVEWFHKHRLIVGQCPEIAQVLKIFEADWFAQNLEPLVFSERESKDGLLEKAKAMLTVYVDGQDGRAPVAVEQSFELELADPETGECLEVYLRGVIDLIEEGETLVDLKTAARSISEGDLARHLQLSTYALVYFLLRGNIPQLRLDVLLKTMKPRLERHLTTRSVEDLGWTARLIERVVRAIEAEHFFPNPSWRCSECEYYAHCQRWRGYEVPREQELVSIAVSGEGVGDAVA